jgi:hypothetical protein
MVQGGGGERLLLEPVEPIRILRNPLREYLDRDLTAKPGVPRPIDLAHPARAEGGKDFIRAEPSAGG